MIEIGEVVHVIHRRTFADDLRRHFVGAVAAASDNAIRVDGFAFVHDASKGSFVRRPERRERIVSLVDSGNIITFLPRYTDLEATHYAYKGGRVLVTDGDGFALEINELGVSR